MHEMWSQSTLRTRMQTFKKCKVLLLRKNRTLSRYAVAKHATILTLQTPRTMIQTVPSQSTRPLKVQGYFETLMTADSHSTNTRVYVIDGTGTSILSKSTAEQLNLLRVGPPASIMPSPINHIKQLSAPFRSLNRTRQSSKEVDVSGLKLK